MEITNRYKGVPGMVVHMEMLTETVSTDGSSTVAHDGLTDLRFTLSQLADQDLADAMEIIARIDSLSRRQYDAWELAQNNQTPPTEQTETLP